MVAILFLPMTILVVLFTYLLAEESFKAKDTFSTIEAWESYYSWVKEESLYINDYCLPTPPSAPTIDYVAVGMTIAGWHPLYGANGWEGIPEPK